MDLFLYQLEDYSYHVAIVTGRVYDKVTLELSRNNSVIATLNGYTLGSAYWGFCGLQEVVKAYMLNGGLVPYATGFSFKITYYYHNRSTGAESSGTTTESYGIWYTEGQ